MESPLRKINLPLVILKSLNQSLNPAVRCSNLSQLVIFIAQNSPPVPGTSPRNSSPVHNDTESNNLSSNFGEMSEI